MSTVLKLNNSVVKLNNSVLQNSVKITDFYNSLLSYWTLNEASGTRADSFGSHPMSPTGVSPGGAAGFGNVGNVTTFSSGTGTLETTIPVVTTGDFTASGWVRLSNNAPSICGVWSQYAPPGDNFSQKIELVHDLGNLTSTLRSTVDNGTHYISGATVVPDETWMHVALTANGSGSTLYLNNNVEGTSGFAPDFTNVFSTLLGVTDGGPLEGALVAWGVWNRVLTRAEIRALYNYGNGVAWPL